ncbi:MAG: transcription antitermination factor NusB [Planctomycetota bacterium]
MTAPIRRRSRAREIAMQVLFQFDVRGGQYADELGSSVGDLCLRELQDAATERQTSPTELTPPTDENARISKNDRELVAFASRLVEGTLGKREDIDKRLQLAARNWDLRRMAAVDRNVLRMAVYELMFCDDVPPKVAINEAIEIGKKFSTANSGGFVNGILDRIRIEIENSASSPTQQPVGPTPSASEATAEPSD